MRVRTLVVVAALLLASVPSGANTLCGQLGDPDGRFFVIYKVKTKLGSLGPVHGYFITEAGVGTPFSGHYGVTAEDYIVLTTSDGSGANGFSAATNFRNWSVPIGPDVSNGSHYGTQANGDITLTIVPTSTSSKSARTSRSSAPSTEIRTAVTPSIPRDTDSAWSGSPAPSSSSPRRPAQGATAGASRSRTAASTC
jgi:hypothetical protein